MGLKKEHNIEKRTFYFARDICLLVLNIRDRDIKMTLGRQLLRSGTAIGANIEEAQGAYSKKDFIHSMNIAKKESRETKYWLCLLKELNSADNAILEKMINESIELIKILTSIVMTAQGK